MERQSTTDGNENLSKIGSPDERTLRRIYAALSKRGCFDELATLRKGLRSGNGLVLENVDLSDEDFFTKGFMSLKKSILRNVNFAGSRFNVKPTTNDELNRMRMSDEHIDRGIDGAVFQGADLTGSDFTGAHLMGVDFECAILRNVKFNGADLRLAILRGADLSGADLSEADCYLAELDKTTFSKDTILDNTRLQGVFVSGDLPRLDAERLSKALGLNELMSIECCNTDVEGRIIDVVQRAIVAKIIDTYFKEDCVFRRDELAVTLCASLQEKYMICGK